MNVKDNRYFLLAEEDYQISCPGCGADEDFDNGYPGKLCLFCGSILEGHFTCVGCGVRRNYSEGGAGEDLLSRACNDCVVGTWKALEATAKYLGGGQRQLPVRAQAVGPVALRLATKESTT